MTNNLVIDSSLSIGNLKSLKYYYFRIILCCTEASCSAWVKLSLLEFGVRQLNVERDGDHFL